MRSVCVAKFRRKQAIVVGSLRHTVVGQAAISGYLAGVTALRMRALIEDDFRLHGRAFRLHGWVRMF